MASSPLSILQFLSSQGQQQQQIGQGQQQVDIQKQQEQRLEEQEQREARQADLDFHQHLVDLGAVPGDARSGLIKDTQTMPSYPGGLGGGQPISIVRKMDPARTVKFKDADGEDVAYELPDAQTQALRQLRLGAPKRAAEVQQSQDTAQATATGTAAGATAGKTADLEARGIAPSQIEVQKFGLDPQQKYLPEDLVGMHRATIAPTIAGDKRLENTGMSIAGRTANTQANIKSREQIAADRNNLEAQIASNRQTLQDAISARTSAVGSGANPNLGRIQLPAIQANATRYMAQQDEADNTQRQVMDAQQVLSETQDGERFTDPFSKSPRVMTPDLRDSLADTIEAKKLYAKTLSGVVQNGMQGLGITPGVKPAGGSSSGQPAQGGGGQPAGSGAAAPQRTPEQNDADDLLNHRTSPSLLMSQIGGRGMQKTAYVNRVKTELRKQDPSFNWEEAESSYQLAKSPGFQQTVRYMDSVQNSMPRLQQAADTLANGNVRAISALTNAGKNQFNNVDLKSFQTDRALVGDEIAKILQGGGTGSGTSDAKLKQAQDLISSSDSPAAIASTLKEVSALIGYRRDSLTRGTPNGLPDGGGKPLDGATAQKFYQAAGGDPAGAREMATRHGWQIPKTQ